jgi:hypothetical protein
MTADELIHDHRDFAHFHDEIVRGDVMNDRVLPICDRLRTTFGALLDLKIPWTFQALGLERGPSKRALQHEALLARTPNPILKARRYEAATAGGTRSYREVAREFGVTREEICQYLTLLRRLPDDLVKSLETETRPEVLRTMSCRRPLMMARSRPRLAIASATSPETTWSS